VRRDQFFVDPPGDEWFEYRPGIRWPESVETPIREVGNARRKIKAEQVR
jgi:hypothetical protein